MFKSILEAYLSWSCSGESSAGWLLLQNSYCFDEQASERGQFARFYMIQQQAFEMEVLFDPVQRNVTRILAAFFISICFQSLQKVKSSCRCLSIFGCVVLNAFCRNSWTESIWGWQGATGRSKLRFTTMDGFLTKTETRWAGWIYQVCHILVATCTTLWRKVNCISSQLLRRSESIKFEARRIILSSQVTASKQKTGM